jgi:hypothetical protein
MGGMTDDDARTIPGTHLRTPWGTVLEVVAVQSGRMPRTIDPSVPSHTSSSERCAMYGGSAKWTTSDKEKA